MSGVSKYDRKQTEKVPPSYEAVKAKFGSENMTIEELTVFLQNSQRENRPYLTDKSVKNYIKAICESSGDLLRPEDFKENPEIYRSPYCIKPTWQSLLVTLMDSDFFDGRKNDRRLKTRADLNQQLAENVNKYLTGDDKRIITENPAFINAELEARLSKHINRELVSLLRTMYHVSPVIRYKLMLEVLKNIAGLNDLMLRQDAIEESIRMVYAHELDKMRDAIYQKRLFSSKSLDELLISLLAVRIHNEEYTYVDENEQMTLIGIHFATQIFEDAFPEKSEAKREFAEWEREFDDEPRMQALREKAERILDMNDPLEHLFYDDLMMLARLRLCRPDVSPEDYERMVRFTEYAIAHDKWDILKRQWKMGDTL